MNPDFSLLNLKGWRGEGKSTISSMTYGCVIYHFKVFDET